VKTPKPDLENTPRFRPDHAFVVQFSSLGGKDAGRVEHLATGRAQSFGNERARMSFMATTLASVESRAESEEE